MSSTQHTPVTSVSSLTVEHPLKASSVSSTFPENSQDEYTTPTQRQPRKRGVAKKRIIAPKRRRIDHEAEDAFIVPDDVEDETPAPKRTKRVAASEPAKTARTKSRPRAQAMSALDRAQKAEERRFAEAKAANKFEAVVKEKNKSPKAPTINSAADKKIRLQTWRSISALPPALSSGRGLDADLATKKTPFEIRALHQSRIEETAGGSQARVETDPNDSQVKIIHLAKYTKQIPVFPNVYTDLDNIVAAPHAYPHVEADMEAGEYGVLRIRWFKGGATDPNYKELSKDALARYKDSSRTRGGQSRPEGARKRKH